MNIESNLGMTLLSNGLSDVTAAGNLQSMTNGILGNSEGSLFQKLISQMLAGSSQIPQASGANGNTGTQSKSGETNNVLAELLLAGGNLAKFRLQSAGKTGESAETAGQSLESAETNENGQTMDAIQALLAGLVNMTTVTTNENVLSQIQNGAMSESQISAIGQIVNTGQRVPENLQYLINGQKNSPEEMAVPMDSKTAPQDGKFVLNDAGLAIAADKTGISDPAISQGMNLQETANTKPVNGKQEAMQGFSQQGIQASEMESGRQPAMAGLQTQEELNAVGAKPKQETDRAETEPGKTEFQNSAQGAFAASAASELNPLTQPAETVEPYTQITNEILNKLEQNGPTEFKMQLEPEDLGQIDIKLKLNEGKLVIDILAANSKTQALLTSQVDKLISSMGLQNVQVESVQVNQQMNSQTQDNSQSQGYTMNSAMDFSQRKQQEQYQQEFFNSGKLAGTLSFQQEDAANTNTADRIGSIRYDSHRMNYAV